MRGNWTRTRYGCPKCGDHTEADSGPDGMVAYRCESCDWWKVYDIGLQPSPKEELEEYSP